EEFIGQTFTLTDQSNLLGGQGKPIEPKDYKIVGVVGDIRNFNYLISKDEGLAEVSKKNGYSTVDEYVKTEGYQSLYVKAVTETDVKGVGEQIKTLGFDSN